MECLRNYIGLRSCNFAPSDSGFYLDELPGISLQMIDQIADAEQVTFAGVWADIQNRAIRRFTRDVLGMISGFDQRYRLRQITQTVDLGKTLTTVTTPPSANNVGVVIELNNPGDAAVCSNMQSLYVQSIQFFCVNPGNFTVTVKDADMGTTLDTFAVTGVSGWNVIKSDKQYDDVARLSITVDSTALTTATLDLSQFNLGGFANNTWFNSWAFSGSGLSFFGSCSGAAQVRGYSVDAAFQNPVYGSNTFGVSCVFSVRCTYNNVVCKNKKHFASAFMWVLGAELMSERIYSPRINRWTTVDAKKAADLRRYYEVQYRGGILDENTQYEGDLKQAVYGIDLDLADCCLECDQQIKWQETQM